MTKILPQKPRGKQPPESGIVLEGMEAYGEFPLTRGSPWEQCKNADDLRSEILRFHEATGARWHSTGAITSEQWLREHYRPGWIRPTEIPEECQNVREPDLSIVVPTVSWPTGDFVHALDLNAMYLAASASLALPTGSPQLVDTHEAGLAALAGIPGFYRPKFSPQFMTHPTAQRFMQKTLGFDPPGMFDSAWIYTSHHRYLEPWAKTWRRARWALLDEGGPALDAVKQTYRQGIGRLGSTRRKNLTDPLYQPYWRLAVQAEARTRLLRRLDGLVRQPIAIDVDCVWFVTNYELPDQLALDYGIPLISKGGGFHHAGSMSRDDAFIAVHTTDRKATALKNLREGLRK